MQRSRLYLSLAGLLCALSVLCSTTSIAQTQYKRHALIEEGTGTWCGYCPYGAYEIDTMTKYMGDDLVVISWHGPKGYNEPMYLLAIDTVASYIKQGGYPWVWQGRAGASAGASTAWLGTAQTQASKAQLADFRIINAVYAGSAVDFDLEITPFDITKMPKEDTTNYVTVVVLTEDKVVESQHRYATPGFTEADIDDFEHMNVARKVAGKALGDNIVIGTKTTVTYPIRRHIHMTLDGSWQASNIRIKAVFARKSKTDAYGETYIDADQSGYVTTLPSDVAPAVWVITPRTGDKIPNDATTIPIIWSASDAASGKATLSYTIDQGKTWTNIASDLTAKSYSWTLPAGVFGKTVQVRVEDAMSNAVLYTSGAFTVAAQAPGVIAISTPVSGDTLMVGQHKTVQFLTSGPVTETRSVSYSTDGGTTWLPINNSITGTSYDWTVPNTPSTNAYIRVQDMASVGSSNGPFTILAPGTVQSLTIQGAPDVEVNHATTLSWAATGYLGKTVDLDISFDNKTTWQPISHAVALSDQNTYNWTTPSTEATNVIIRASFSGGQVAFTSPFNLVKPTTGGVAPEIVRSGSVTVSPNPMSASATIAYDLMRSASVTFVMYDLLGREVARLTSGVQGTGAHQLTLDVSRLPAGSYAYSLAVTGGKSVEGKISISR